MASTTNIFVKTFTGLGLPPTLSLPTPSSTPISELFEAINSHLPPIHSQLLLSTVSGTVLQPRSQKPVSSLLGPEDDFVTLRLHVPLCGGKGGFGSQLRAAGGRMSSRKKKGQENNDSCRNLDGRRMRTVKEAKALAQYLQTQPDMDKKEKEKRKERWEKVIEAADDKIKGKDKNERFDDTKWLEEKDDIRDKTRDAVIRAMKANGGRVPSPDKSSTSEDISDDNGEGSSKTSSSDEEVTTRPKVARPVKFAGFDDDDEFMSSSDEEEELDEGDMEDIAEEDEDENEEVAEGKGKAKAL